MRRLQHILFGTALAVAVSACSSLKQDHTLGWSAAQLYKAGKEELNDGSYSSAEEYYTKLLSRFPYGKLAQQSQLDLAYAYYKSGEPEKALAQIDDFLRTYPQHPYADYALFMKGVVEYEQNISLFSRLIPTNLSQTDPEQLKKAFDDFNLLVQRYPKSEYAEDARYRMVYIRNLLGEHSLEIANYYLRQGAYVSAIARAKQVLEKYEQSPSAPYALAIMIRAYQEAGEQKLANDARRVFEQNYANMKQDKEIEEILHGDVSKQRTFWQRLHAQPKV